MDVCTSTTPALASILIPTFNRPKLVVDAIRSAISQTYRPIEILVLDNASDVPLDSLLSSMETESAGVPLLYVRHERNLGITGNWRRGIELATGEFFCLLHDDDTIEKSFLAELIAPLLADATLALSFCDHWVMDASGRRMVAATDECTRRFHRDRLPAGKLENFPEAALVHHSIPVGASVFRRSKATPEMISDEAHGAIDYWLLLRILQTKSSACYVPQRLMNYRLHGGGMSHSRSNLEMNLGHVHRFDAILSDPAFRHLHPWVKATRSSTLLSHSIDLLALGRRQEARHYVRRALRGRWPGARGITTFLLAASGKIGTAIARRLVKIS